MHGPKRDATGRAVVHLGPPVPILRVADFERSIDYYQRILGFTLDWRDDRFGSITRDHLSLMLSEGSQGHSGTWLWASVSDVDAFHDELVARGAHIRHAPTNFPWGSREMHVFDPDGHVIRFGADAPEGAPLGPWLDEDGIYWQPHADGRWTRLEEPRGK